MKMDAYDFDGGKYIEIYNSGNNFILNPKYIRNRFNKTKVTLDICTFIKLHGKSDEHPQLKASGLEDTTFKLKQSGHGQVNILYI